MITAIINYMRERQRNRLLLAGKTVKTAIGSLLVLLTLSCAIPLTVSPPPAEVGTFNLFLQPLPQEAQRLNFSFSELVALRDDGIDIPLKIRQPVMTTEPLIKVQQKLASLTLPPGQYLGLRLQIEQVTTKGEEGEMALLPPAKPILLNYPFTVIEKQAETLFLSLSADRLVTDGAFFTPKFSLWKPERMLTNLKGFVSNGNSQSLTIFNKRSALVTDLLRVGKKPQDLALDRRRGWLYVAMADEDLIVVVEVSNGEILGQARLRFGDEPTELALSPSGKRLLVLNQGSNSVSIIDTASLAELGRIRLDSAANDIFIGRNEDFAYVVHTVSSTLSLLDLKSLRVRTSAILADAPVKGVVGKDGKTLYLTTDFSADLLVVNGTSLSVQEKIFVGNGAGTIIMSRVTGLLYIGRQDGEIAVVDPEILTAIDSIRLPGPIQALAIDYEENSLLALLPQSRRLFKIDLVSKRLIGFLPLESASHAVVVMGGR